MAEQAVIATQMEEVQPTKTGPVSKFAWWTLGLNIFVILWGAYVRATGSGAGCGGHWPLCNGVVIPRQPALETLIEFTHRISSGAALLFVAVLLILALRRYPTGHRVRTAATIAAGLIFFEALLGAGLVLFDLVGGNTSISRAAAGAAHLVNTFLLLASLSLAAAWSTWAHGPVVRPVPRGMAVSLGLGLAGVILIGMTGSIAALGDTLFPAVTIAEGFRQDFDSASHLLLRLRSWHPIIAVLVSTLLLGIARSSYSGREDLVRLRAMLAGLTIIQLLAGALNVLLLAPIWLQLLHLLLADLLWISLVLLADRARREPNVTSP
jgi:heme A synthase